VQQISYDKMKAKPDSKTVSLSTSRVVVDDSWVNPIVERPSVLLEDKELLGKLCKEYTFSSPEFLSSVYNYFEVHNKQLYLLDWAIQEEVNSTAGVHDLFRGDSIATHLFYIIFFGDLGKRYLRATIIPLVKLVLASKAGALETDSAKVGKEVDTEANARLQIEFSMKFLEFLNKSSDTCPLILREALSLVRKHIAVRFPEAKHILGVIIFLRFFCPTLVFPLKHGLTSEAELGRPLTEDVERGLVLLSKTMQSLANGVELEASKPYAELFNKFIVDFNPKIRDFAEDLINEKFIRMSRRIIEASVKPPDTTQIAEAEDQLKAAIAKARPHDDTPAGSSAGSVVEPFEPVNIIAEKAKLFDELSLYGDWKQVSFSKSNGVGVYKGKEETEFANYWKVVFTADASLGTMKRLSPLELEEWDSKMFFSECLETFDKDLSDWHTLFQPPIFSAPRDFVTTVFRHAEGDSRWYQLTFSTERPDCPPSKKIVRAEIPFKALLLERSQKDPNKAVHVIQFTTEETTATILAKDAKTFKKHLKQVQSHSLKKSVS